MPMKVIQMQTKDVQCLSCKECKHFDLDCMRCGKYNCGAKPNDYCYYAEKKEEE
jgi:hypothetical protein